MQRGGGALPPLFFLFAQDCSRRMYRVVIRDCSTADTLFFFSAFCHIRQFSSWAIGCSCLNWKGRYTFVFSQITEGWPGKAGAKKGTFQPWLPTQIDQRWHHEPRMWSACDPEIASSSSQAFEARNPQSTLIRNFYRSGLLESVLFQFFRGKRT